MADQAHGQPQKARLFFALWPDDAVRRQLTAHRQTTGRPVPPENWHITLLFLGAVDPERRVSIEAAADAVLVPPFDLRLDRFGYWRRAGVAWLGVSDVPPALLSLHAGLRMAAVASGIDVEARRYRPHLTLARHAEPARSRPIDDPIEWEVKEFCLVQSETLPSGARYSVRRRWPLQAGVGAAGSDVK